MNNLCECCQSKLKFIRLINGNYMHSMVIPEWFVNSFGGKISRTVKLEAPDGNIYEVGVSQNMNRTILKTGWAAFVYANQIEENYSLLFRHHGNAQFEVTIFDSNGKEKVSCCARTKNACVNRPNMYDVVNNYNRSCGGTNRSSAREGSDSDRSQKESSYEYENSAKTPAISYSSEEYSEDNPSVDDSMESDDRQMISDYIVLSGHCYLTEEQEMKIQELVMKMRPELPVLVVVMKKTNVKQYGNLVIRKDYARKYFPCEDTNIILRVPMKKNTWNCKFRIRQSGMSGAGRRNLYLGNFVSDNHVREGDIWLFQPMANVKKRRFTMTFHLLHKASIDHSPDRTCIGSNHGRTSTHINCVKEEPPTDGEEVCSSDHEEHGASESSEGASVPPFILPNGIRLTPAQEKKVLQKVEKIESELPIYVAIMNKMNVCRSNTSPILNFGVRYATTYLQKKHVTGHHGKHGVIRLVLQREGKSRTWATEMRWCMRRHSSHQLRVLKGWTFFSRANNLREGDLCLFKLMKNEEPLKMMVYIIRRDKC